MKKIVAVISLLVIAFSVTGCRDKTETVEEYNKKLVSGEIDPDVKKISKDKKKNKKSDDEIDDKKDENVKIADSSGVSVNIPEEELASLVDASDEEYASFEVVDMPSENLFMGKKLNAVAMLSQHEMTMLQKGAITMEINNTNLTFNYIAEEGAQQKEAFIYKISPKILTTSAGRDYTYIVYGTEPITEGEINGTVGIIRMIKMKGSVDMGENAADTYILYEETSQPGSYYLMTVEE